MELLEQNKTNIDVSRMKIDSSVSVHDPYTLSHIENLLVLSWVLSLI